MSTTQYLSSWQYEQTVTTDASKKPNPDIHYDLVSFLSVAQRFNIDFLPVMWNALDAFGKGATSAVHQSTVGIELEFAFKRTSLLINQGSAKAYQVLISEVFILGTPSIRRHPNIVDLEGICWEIDDHENLSPVFVFQKAQRGDLAGYLKSDAGSESSFDTRLKLCLDIGNAIAALHSGDIVHGDIKPQNILVFENSEGHITAKVTDFGYSCLGSTREDIVSLPRSQPWNAPELVLQSDFKLGDAKKTDVYSFGLVCLCTLFQKNSGEDSMPQISESQLREWKPQDVLPNVHRLLFGMDWLGGGRQASLLDFFQSTLQEIPDRRDTDFNTLMNYLQKQTPNTNPLSTQQLLKPDLDALLHAICCARPLRSPQYRHLTRSA